MESDFGKARPFELICCLEGFKVRLSEVPLRREFPKPLRQGVKPGNLNRLRFVKMET
jgi:hypothetical protein